MAQSNSKVAISVQSVYKDFALPHEKKSSLKSNFVHPLKRTKTVGMYHALRDISFEIKEGEFFGIVGRNGSGKSTLLKIIAGIYQPTSGTTRVNGRLVPFIELGVGFNPELTGRENVYLNGALMGFSSAEVKKKYHSIVEFSELEQFMDQKLKNYSSGMQVRLAFSVATILADSDILLVDEVLAVGDADFQKKCFDYFRKLKKLKKTVIFVSHDMNAVVEYCDRAILIEESQLVVEGEPEKVAVAYRKMFLSQEEDQDDEAPDRWGDGAMTITKRKISKKHLSDDDKTLVLEFEVKANKNVELPLLGFGLRSPTGNVLLGTNNHIAKQPLKSMKSGDTLKTRWDIPNIFADGTYTIDLAAEYVNGGEVADRWESALEFDVTKEQRTPFGINPSIPLTMERANDKAK